MIRRKFERFVLERLQLHNVADNLAEVADAMRGGRDTRKLRRGAMNSDTYLAHMVCDIDLFLRKYCTQEENTVNFVNELERYLLSVVGENTHEVVKLCDDFFVTVA